MRRLTCILLLLTHVVKAQLPCPSIPQLPIAIEQPTFDRQEKVVVPIVIHIIYANEKQNVSALDLHKQLELLNEAFNNVAEKADPLTRPNIGEVGFDFKLVELDEDGSPSTGLLRTSTDVIGIGDVISSNSVSAVKSDEDGGSKPWNIDKYLNIWIAERNSSLGYTVSANSEIGDVEGIVLDYREVLGNTKTIIHEAGHFFGLLHPWGNMIGCDEEDDGIADTPFQVAPNFTCSLSNACSQRLEPGNFMDFSSDECLYFFTKLQASSMQSFATFYKNELISNNECFLDNLPLASSMSIFYNGSSLEIYFGDDRRDQEIQVYSIGGALLKCSTTKGENYININLDGIPLGVYVLVFESEDGIESKKVLLH